MKIPKNMTEAEVYEVFNSVIDRIAPRYTFNGYDINDIKQESYIICMSAMDRYIEGRPLENFLSVNLSNRLKNLLRDNHVYNTNEQKKQVSHPTMLSETNYISFEEKEDQIEIKEIKEIIDMKLPVDMRKDYLKMIAGISIKPSRKEEIINTIKGIISQ